MRSIHLQKDKGVFKFDELPLEEFASSLGLAGAPQVKFMSKDASSSKKNAVRAAQHVELLNESSSDDEDEEPTDVFGNKHGSTAGADDQNGPSQVRKCWPLYS